MAIIGTDFTYEITHKSNSSNVDLEFIAGDTEKVQYNLVDNTNDVILLEPSDYTCTLFVKRDKMNTEYIFQKSLEIVTYDEFVEPYSIKLELAPTDTLALLNYANKQRAKLLADYSIVLKNINTLEEITISKGNLLVTKTAR